MANLLLPSNQDGGRTIISYLSVLGPETDGYQVISPDDFIADQGTWTWTRDSAGLYHLATTAGAQTTHLALNLGKVGFARIGTDPSIPPGGAENPFPGTKSGTPPGGGQPHLYRGVEIQFVDMIYSITGAAALTTHTIAFFESTFANGSAVPTPVSKGGTLSPTTLDTATSANLYVKRTTLGTPFVVDSSNAADVIDYMELTVVQQALGGYSLYMCGIGFNRILN